MDECTFRNADGVDVFYRRWLPPDDPTLVVVIAHGMSEHSGRYARAPRERGRAATRRSTQTWPSHSA